MNFAVGKEEIFRNVGFNTESWRHSIDGQLVLVHAEFAETLLGDLDKYPDIRCYAHQEEDFQQILEEFFTESLKEHVF